MIEIRDFCKLPDGSVAKEFIVTNAGGSSVRLCSLGATILAVMVPDRNGVLQDVVLGYRKPEMYLQNPCCFGSVVGRYANRVRNGKFELEGVSYQLEQNETPNCLHSGSSNFARRNFEFESGRLDGNDYVKFSLLSPHMDGGFPGNLKLEVFYTYSDDNALSISYMAQCDRTTVLNLTNHTYFNLNGARNSNVSNQWARINSLHKTVNDDQLIPTGEIIDTADSVYDLNDFQELGGKFEHLKCGYDDNFILTDDCASFNEASAEVYSPLSGIKLSCYTTEPAIQFYTGYFLDGSIEGKNGCFYPQYGGFCLEAQHYPDSMNHEDFPSCQLKRGEIYRQITVYKFTTMDSK